MLVGLVETTTARLDIHNQTPGLLQAECFCASFSGYEGLVGRPQKHTAPQSGDRSYKRLVLTGSGDMASFDRAAFEASLAATMGSPVTILAYAEGSVVVTAGATESQARDLVAYANDGRLSSAGVESVAVQGQTPVAVGMLCGHMQLFCLRCMSLRRRGCVAA
jgi:hypothetical protein